MEKRESDLSARRQEGTALNTFSQSDRDKLIRALGATAAKAANRDELVQTLGRIATN